MKRAALLVALAAALLVPEAVSAQAASPTETQLQLERQQRRLIVRPSPSAEAIERDAQEAAVQAEQAQRQQEIARDLRRPSRRPDLDYDVKTGIQSQRLNDALHRR
jgi:hypothetical protein